MGYLPYQLVSLPDFWTINRIWNNSWDFMVPKSSSWLDRYPPQEALHLNGERIEGSDIEMYIVSIVHDILPKMLHVFGIVLPTFYHTF